MPRRRRKKLSMSRAFAAIGDAILRTGKRAEKQAPPTPELREEPKVKDEVSKRLLEIKRLEFLREEELREEMRAEEEEERWEEREELKRPLSERLSDVFYGVLKKPAERMVTSFKGLGTDLYRANMDIAPERYVAFVIGMGIIVGIAGILLTLLMRIPPIFSILAGFLGFLFTFAIGKSYPRRRAFARATDVNRLIPYALRHMATQLSSGIGLPESMVSVSRAGYGALSEEFERSIHDMNTGMSMEEALAAMDARVNSEPLTRAIRQILRTLRTGGDLSRTLNVLADETAFEMRMKLRDYVQSLNLMTMIYMFASAVVPSMLMVVIMIMGARGGGGMSPQTAGMLYLVLIPFMLFYFVFMIKRFEPRL
jgi:flagellar protein FlaJ